MCANFTIEKELGGIIVGVDEVGRGALAGPVVAASILIPAVPASENLLTSEGVRDSKKLTAKQRERLYCLLTKTYEYQISFIDNNIIDAVNILKATMMAMTTAIKGLVGIYDHIIVDGRDKPFVANNMHTFINGDGKSLSIAAASIIAKVARDKFMATLANEFPSYRWASNVGYGSKEHINAIKKFGYTKYHRKSFLNKILTNTQG